MSLLNSSWVDSSSVYSAGPMPKTIVSCIAKRSGNRSEPCPGELQSVQPEDDFRRRFNAHVRVGNQLLDARDRRGETLARGVRIDRANQSRRQVTVVAEIEFLADSRRALPPGIAATSTAF